MSNPQTAASAAPTDDELVARAREGDDRAFRLIVERYESLVAATVVSMLGRGAEAEDVGQETFIRFFDALDRFRGDSTAGTYLTRIAINLSLNAIQRRKRLRGRFLSRDASETPLPEPADDAEPSIYDRERAELVQRAIRTLEPKFRAVVVLRLVNGYSTRETAGLLKVPQGTVLSRLSRAQQKLKAVLGPYLDLSDEA